MNASLLLRLLVCTVLCATPVLKLAAQADTVFNPKKEVVFENKRFRVYNNWISGGAGPAWHSDNPRTQLALGLNFNFHIKQYYFRFGGMFSGDRFGTWNNYNVHAGYIFKRHENEKRNIAYLAGISYNTGYRFIYAGHYDGENPYQKAGLYLEYQYILKLNYDFGVGAALFADINDLNQIVGLRVDVFFSGAYRGYVRGKEPVKRN
ncbi:MAG: hypothetical protein IM638_08255 [Bacteroidetes bacterium]|nr:hypothetical protein [Bacteroidota bacterium]